MPYAILRTTKLRTTASLAGSARHTFRERPTPNADAVRTPRNRTLGAQNTSQVLAAVKARLPAKRRKDAVICIEYLVTASPEFFAGQEQSAYLAAGLDWLRRKHGVENVVCANWQLDETSPHLVAYVVPLTPDGRLCAKDFLGGAAKLRALQTDFHAKVGAPFGLSRGAQGSTATHQKVSQFYAALNQAPAPVALSATDHLAAAVGLSTARLALQARNQARLTLRATAPGVASLKAARRDIEALHQKLARRDAELRDARARADALARDIALERRKSAELEQQLTTAAETQWQRLFTSGDPAPQPHTPQPPRFTTPPRMKP